MSEEEPKLGAYAPPAEEYETFDARVEERDRPGPLLLFASLAFVVLMVAVVYSAYKQGVREGGRNAAPRITADAEPYRELPADPGGYETPGQDIEAYERRQGNGGNSIESIDTASVRPGPEEPVDTRPSLQVETTSADQMGADEAQTSPAPQPQETTRQPEPQPVVRQPEPQPTPTPASQPSARESLPQPQAPARTVPQPQPRQETPRETPPASATPAASTPANTNGDYVVQIGAFRSTEEADQAWARFTSRHASLARGHGRDVIRVDLGDRGIYHRLRIAGFETRDEASTYCTALKGEGQDCLVARR
ncbi:SPOR domain-containing protein [Woodsholea maritima]|uniref:SPOR domain-containing protein n=1 Tax=Woodsholea maritima TaxID=240237 RepID=UPI00037A2F88|nr:SPOR domain-containing protein [Woodsholea maritima]